MIEVHRWRKEDRSTIGAGVPGFYLGHDSAFGDDQMANDVSFDYSRISADPMAVGANEITLGDLDIYLTPALAAAKETDAGSFLAPHMVKVHDEMREEASAVGTSGARFDTP